MESSDSLQCIGWVPFGRIFVCPCCIARVRHDHLHHNHLPVVGTVADTAAGIAAGTADCTLGWEGEQRFGWLKERKFEPLLPEEGS